MYRHLKVTKFVPGKRAKTYKNLASFNKECPSRGDGGMICFTTNVRCLRDGGGLATVGVTKYMGRGTAGRWRLHFADCGVMKRHLKKRTASTRGTLGRGR